MILNISPEIKETIDKLHQKAINGVHDSIPFILLHIGGNYIIAAKYTAEDNHPYEIMQLSIGYETISQNIFRHNPPTSSEVEEAIMVTEDQIMNASREHIFNKCQIITSDTIVKEIASNRDKYEKDKIVNLHEVEAVFSRFAAIVCGRPASLDDLPLNNKFTASLLILRELMHHLNFNEIAIY